MKTFILSILILLLPCLLNAQQKDLKFYIDRAKTQSPLINKENNNSIIADLDLKQIKSILSKPNIKLDANILFAPIISHDNNSNRLEWISSDAAKYTGYDLSYADGGQYQAIISIQQALFTGSRYSDFSTKTEISKKINANNIELTKHELEQLVSHQYILCLKSLKQNKVSLQLLNELKQQLLIMNKLVENAIYDNSDLMLLQIEYQNFEIEQLTYLEEYKNNLCDLNLICGISDTSLIEIQDVDFKIKSEYVSGSHFLVKYKLDSLNLDIEQTIYEQKYKPQLNLYADAGLNAIYIPDFNRFGFSTGISFSWNIFDGNQRKVEREKTIIKLQTLKFDEQNFGIQTEINKNKYLNKINSVNKKIDMVTTQLSEYNKLLNLYKLRLSKAQISIMDFKNLIKDITSKSQENILLGMEKQALINSFNYWNY